MAPRDEKEKERMAGFFLVSPAKGTSQNEATEEKAEERREPHFQGFPDDPLRQAWFGPDTIEEFNAAMASSSEAVSEHRGPLRPPGTSNDNDSQGSEKIERDEVNDDCLSITGSSSLTWIEDESEDQPDSLETRRDLRHYMDEKVKEKEKVDNLVDGLLEKGKTKILRVMPMVREKPPLPAPNFVPIETTNSSSPMEWNLERAKAWGEEEVNNNVEESTKKKRKKNKKKPYNPRRQFQADDYFPAWLSDRSSRLPSPGPPTRIQATNDSASSTRVWSEVRKVESTVVESPAAATESHLSDSRQRELEREQRRDSTDTRSYSQPRGDLRERIRRAREERGRGDGRNTAREEREHQNVRSTAREDRSRSQSRKRGELAVKQGSMKYKYVASIPTNSTINPPPRSCFNCWQPGHNRRQYPRPATMQQYCFNCGRREVEVSNCPRSSEAYRRATGSRSEPRSTEKKPQRSSSRTRMEDQRDTRKSKSQAPDHQPERPQAPQQKQPEAQPKRDERKAKSDKTREVAAPSTAVKENTPLPTPVNTEAEDPVQAVLRLMQSLQGLSAETQEMILRRVYAQPDAGPSEGTKK